MVSAEPPAMSEQASVSISNPLRAAPNLLTLARICLAPFLVVAVLEGHFAAGLALFIVAGLTDAFDGLLARMLKQRTVLGQYLDPVADKLLLSTLFLVLHHENLISRRVTVLVFGRDLGILMVGAILYASVGMRNFKPSIFGKANTLAQIIALLAVLLSQFYAPALVLATPHFALLATIGFTVISGFHYAWQIPRPLSFSGTPANG